MSQPARATMSAQFDALVAERAAIADEAGRAAWDVQHHAELERLVDAMVGTSHALTPEQQQEENQREDHGRSQAAAQVASIVDMVAAHDVDRDRLQELRDEREAYETEAREASEEYEADPTDGLRANMERAVREFALWREQWQEELDELTEAAGETEDEDDARERIQEDPLSIEVRSEWMSMSDWGSSDDSAARRVPDEFRIVLCTGGPHVELQGEFNCHGEPCSVRVLYQDWFTGKTEYIPEDSDHRAAVLRYCEILLSGYF